MAIKSKELEALAAGAGCLGKAKDDEPLFILRAQDLLAPELVRSWARRAKTHLGPNNAKVREALALAEEMEYWGRNNGAKLPD